MLPLAEADNGADASRNSDRRRVDPAAVVAQAWDVWCFLARADYVNARLEQLTARNLGEIDAHENSVQHEVSLSR